MPEYACARAGTLCRILRVIHNVPATVYVCLAMRLTAHHTLEILPRFWFSAHLIRRERDVASIHKYLMHCAFSALNWSEHEHAGIASRAQATETSAAKALTSTRRTRQSRNLPLLACLTRGRCRTIWQAIAGAPDIVLTELCNRENTLRSHKYKTDS